MRPVTVVDLVFAFVLGFLSAGPNLTLPDIGLPTWVLPVGGETAPFTASVPCVLNVYDSTPSAVKDLDTAHPGIADIFASDAAGSAHEWITKHNGDVRLIDKSIPKPEMDKQWVKDAYDAWKAKGGKVPWTVGAGPTKRGFNQAPPETQPEMVKLLTPLSK